MTASTEDWLNQVQEDVVDPETPIIDPHIHLWASQPASYLPADLAHDTCSGHIVLGVVFVECGTAHLATGPASLRPVGETRFAAALAQEMRERRDPQLSAIIGASDLREVRDIDRALEGHLAAGEGLFRGIRHSAAYDPSSAVRRSHHNPPPHLYLDDAFRIGFSRLSPLGLTFDAWLYHPQLPELTDLAAAFPETTIILNHLGGPLGVGPYEGVRDEVFRSWRRSMSELAQRPNVVVKLGGLCMPVNGFGFHKARRPPTSSEIIRAQGDYYRTAIDLFGPERAMFESNFPVERNAVSYRTIWNAFKRLTEPFTPDERCALLRGTAQRIYRLQS
jgi:predicted TIM-barrel fold metal-dependent hydrolase